MLSGNILWLNCNNEGEKGGVTIFNATFNYISVILCWPLLLEETGVSSENNQPVKSH